MNFKLQLTSYRKWPRGPYRYFILPIIFVVNWKWQRGICVYTFARRWTQCSDQEGDAAASCGPSNRAQDRSMWTTREPTAGAWRTRGSYLRTGSLREQDFSFYFLHILQKTGILVLSQNLYFFKLFFAILWELKKLSVCKQYKIHSFWCQLWLLW